MPLLQLTNVQILRNNVSLCSGISLTVEPGDVVHVRGHNGTGKSSFFAGIMGLHGVSLVGEVLWRDQPLIGTVHERAARGIFLLYQQPVALPGVSVLALLRAMRQQGGEVLGYGALFAEVRPLLERLQFSSEILERSVHADFSGGERKMLELLFLLWARPSLVFVDELEAGLDSGRRSLAVAILRELAERGVAILFASHDEAFASALQPNKEIILG